MDGERVVISLLDVRVILPLGIFDWAALDSCKKVQNPNRQTRV